MFSVIGQLVPEAPALSLDWGQQSFLVYDATVTQFMMQQSHSSHSVMIRQSFVVYDINLLIPAKLLKNWCVSISD